MKQHRSLGFSLVEVTLAIGVIAFALIAIMGLIPIGTKSGRDSIDATRTSMIAQTVFNRIKANMVSNDSSSAAYFSPYASGVNSFFFFTSDGLPTGELLKVPWSSTDQPMYYTNVTNPKDFYRAQVHVSTFDQTVSYPVTDPRYTPASANWNLLCATVSLSWPVNPQNGTIVSSSVNAAKTTYTFLIRKP